LLQIDRLSVRFGAATVVNEVSFEIAPGEKFALVGESGSGKSITALSVLRLVDAATSSGAIRFAGEDLMQRSEAQMQALRGAQIGMIFQEPMTALNPLYTVGNQIIEVLELHEALDATAARARAIELLRRTGIPEPERRIDVYPHQLSGGQRQRAMIAMALACKPRLLIADEPTTALDVTIQAQILALLDELQREMGMAVLFITHDLNLVQRFTDRVGVMERGVLVECGDTAEVFARPQHAYTRRLLATRPQRVVQPLPADAPVLVDAQAVRVSFDVSTGWFSKRAFHAVEKATLQLRRGETLGIVGESGSGKTTLGMALLALQPIAAGQVQVGGVRVDNAPPQHPAGDAQAAAGGAAGPVRLAVAPHDGGADRRRGPGAAPARAQRGSARGQGAGDAGRSGPVGAQRRARRLLPLPSRVLRRPAPAHRDRPCRGARARDPGARRTHIGAGRVGAAAGAGPAGRAAAAARPELRVHQPRPGRHPRDGAPGDGDEGRAGGRGGRGAGAVRCAPAGLHAGTPGRGPPLLDAAGVSHHYLGYGSYLGEWRRRNAIKMWTGWPTLPMVFVKGVLVGGADDLAALVQSGELARLLKV
jgi:ABC-type dipeptide/oligopeptide/nickel transport system ATPase component